MGLCKGNKFFVIGESIPTTTSGPIESSSISFVRVSSILHSCAGCHRRLCTGRRVTRAGSRPHHIDHCTVRVKVAVCVAEPAVPVIVTSYVPAGVAVDAVVDVVVFEVPPHPTAVEAARIVSAKPSCTYHRLLFFRRRSSVQPRNPPPPKNASAVVPPEPWPGNAG